MNAVVQLNQITHCFGSRVALNQVSFNIAPGEVFGLLGPNGAGKTTTIRLLRGCPQPNRRLDRDPCPVRETDCPTKSAFLWHPGWVE